MRILVCVFYCFIGLSLAAEGESLLFLGSSAPEARAMLLRVPTATPKLTSASGEVEYAAGRDFSWKPGSREVTLMEGSRIPFLKDAELHPPPHSPNSYAASRNGTSWMLYGPGHWFHDRQCTVSYESLDAWSPPSIQPADAGQLDLLRAKLKSKQAVTMVMLGDSISTCLDSSGKAAVAPFQPGYPELVVNTLKHKFGTAASLVNLSVSGKTAPWGLTQAPAVINAKPDVVLLAFGMNDASGKHKPANFAKTVAEIIATVRAGLPECEFILVSSMTANPDWDKSSPDLYPQYEAALEGLRGPGVALARVTTRWQSVLERKGFLSLTGNGLNHPNDYGHRLYAEVVLQTISPEISHLAESTIERCLHYLRARSAPLPLAITDAAKEEAILARPDPGSFFLPYAFALKRQAKKLLTPEQTTKLEQVMATHTPMHSRWHDERNTVRCAFTESMWAYAAEDGPAAQTAQSQLQQWMALRMNWTEQEHLAQYRFARAVWEVLTPDQQQQLIGGEWKHLVKEDTGHTRGDATAKIITRALGKPDRPEAFDQALATWSAHRSSLHEALQKVESAERRIVFAMDLSTESMAVAAGEAARKAYAELYLAEAEAIRQIVTAGYSAPSAQCAKAASAAWAEAGKRFGEGAAELIRLIDGR